MRKSRILKNMLLVLTAVQISGLTVSAAGDEYINVETGEICIMRSVADLSGSGSSTNNSTSSQSSSPGEFSSYGRNDSGGGPSAPINPAITGANTAYRDANSILKELGNKAAADGNMWNSFDGNNKISTGRYKLGKNDMKRLADSIARYCENIGTKRTGNAGASSIYLNALSIIGRGPNPVATANDDDNYVDLRNDLTGTPGAGPSFRELNDEEFSAVTQGIGISDHVGIGGGENGSTSAGDFVASYFGNIDNDGMFNYTRDSKGRSRILFNGGGDSSTERNGTFRNIRADIVSGGLSDTSYWIQRFRSIMSRCSSSALSDDVYIDKIINESYAGKTTSGFRNVEFISDERVWKVVDEETGKVIKTLVTDNPMHELKFSSDVEGVFTVMCYMKAKYETDEYARYDKYEYIIEESTRMILYSNKTGTNRIHLFSGTKEGLAPTGESFRIYVHDGEVYNDDGRATKQRVKQIQRIE